MTTRVARAACALGVLAAASCSHAKGGGLPRATFSPCYDAYECATVTVPVDWSNPGGATIDLALLRAPATGTRVGTIFVNPGGPGQAMVERMVAEYRTLRIGFAEATEKFDIVAFDWRGVGLSAPLKCVPDSFLDGARAADLTMTRGDLAGLDALTKTLVGGCTADPNAALLTHVDAESAARDLDRMRIALGESKLDFLGYSYGGWLGATYATLFPDNVGAMVLDAGNALGTTLTDDVTRSAKTFEAGLARFFDACARDATSKLHAADAAAVAARYDALIAKIARGGASAGGRALSSVDAQAAVASGLRSGNFTKLASDLAAAESGDGSALLSSADAAAGRGVDGRYDDSFVAHLAIACLDQPPDFTLQSFASFTNDLRVSAPRATSEAVLPWALCAQWPWRRAAAPQPIAAPRAAPLLIVSGRYDPIVSYDQGRELANRLANGSYVLTYEGEGHAASLHSACVRSVVTQFFLSPTTPPATESCPAE